MLRKRLIAVLTFLDGVLFRTKEFVADYRYTANFVDAFSIDELVLLDIGPRDAGDRTPFERVVAEFASRCFVPLTAGGGVTSLADVHRLMRLGADKVAVNTGAWERPDLVNEIAAAYGTQCIVGSIDAKRRAGGGWEVLVDRGRRATGRDPVDWATELANRGAGEILMTSIDRDGSLEGYELDLCAAVAAAVPVPVLIAAGAGSWRHFVDGVEKGRADAVCTTNIYHFTETSIRSAKAFMARNGIAVRT